MKSVSHIFSDLPAFRAKAINELDVEPFKLPIGQWPADRKLREVGAFQLVAMLEGIQGLTMAPLTRHLGWDPNEVEVFIAEVRKEFKNRKIHSYFPL